MAGLLSSSASKSKSHNSSVSSSLSKSRATNKRLMKSQAESTDDFMAGIMANMDSDDQSSDNNNGYDTGLVGGSGDLSGGMSESKDMVSVSDDSLFADFSSAVPSVGDSATVPPRKRQKLSKSSKVSEIGVGIESIDIDGKTQLSADHSMMPDSEDAKQDSPSLDIEQTEQHQTQSAVKSAIVAGDDEERPFERIQTINEAMIHEEDGDGSQTQRASSSTLSGNLTRKSGNNDSSSLSGYPPECDPSENKLNVYWFDLFEDPVLKPGTVYLFGKHRDPSSSLGEEWKSVCVIIKGLQRCLYLLPKLEEHKDPDDSSTADSKSIFRSVDVQKVYGEIDEFRRRHFPSMKSFRVKMVKKRLCFGDLSKLDLRNVKDARTEPVDLVRVRWGFEFGTPDPDKAGRFYQCVFGARVTALEQLVLDVGLKGPGWVRIPFNKDQILRDQRGRFSFCDTEIHIDDGHLPNVIERLDSNYCSPPLKIVTLSLQTTLNAKKEHEVGLVSLTVYRNVSVELGDRSKKMLNQSQSQSGMISSQSQTQSQSQSQQLSATLVGGRRLPDEYLTVARQINQQPWPHDLKTQLRKGNYNERCLKLCSNEKQLLTFLLEQLKKHDPDVLVSHKLNDFVLEVLISRMKQCNIGVEWSYLGRLRRRKYPMIAKTQRLLLKQIGNGRLLLDTFKSAQEFLYGQPTYTLSHLVNTLLYNSDPKREHSNYDASKIAYYFGDGQALAKVICKVCNDSVLITQLVFRLQILELTKELTQLCGNLWQRSLQSQRAERNEYLLLHEFHRHGFIVPERLSLKEKIERGIVADRGSNNGSNNSRRRKKEASYQGGLVLEPIRGLYDKLVMLLDFNSLYPSIIQEYNLCFTTVDHWKSQKESSLMDDHHFSSSDSDDASLSSISDKIRRFGLTNNTANVSSSSNNNAEEGVLPRVISVLLGRRTQVKQQLKKLKKLDINKPDQRQQQQKRRDDEYMRLDVEQKALKLVANSMYGCLGFNHSRFYCKPIAELITRYGREALQSARHLCESVDEKLKVIYGDTDSIMVYTHTSDLKLARSLAREVKRKINLTYRKMYLELDDMYAKMLLLKKKKYAALKITQTDPKTCAILKCEIEVKGLDLVRRDWSVISKNVGKEVLNRMLILNNNNNGDDQGGDVVGSIHEYLNQVRKKMDDDELALDQYVITKKLSKHPKKYGDADKQAHVQVALAMENILGMAVSVGDFIPYVVCNEYRNDKIIGNTDTGDNLALRCYHLSELTKNNNDSDNNNDGGESSESDKTSKKKKKKLTIDKNYYLSTQILQPVIRYCDVIEGTDAGQLAHALGLDSSKYAHLSSNHHNNHHGSQRSGIDEANLMSYEDDYSSNYHMNIESFSDYKQRYQMSEVKPLKLRCRYCRSLFDFGGVINMNDHNHFKSGLNCPTPGCQGLLSSSTDMNKDLCFIKNTIFTQLSDFIRQYYNRSPMKSSSLDLSDAGGSSSSAESYTNVQLCEQMRYFAYLFDRKKHEMEMKQRIIQQRRSGVNAKSSSASASSASLFTLSDSEAQASDDIHDFIQKNFLNRNESYYVHSSSVFAYLL